MIGPFRIGQETVEVAGLREGCEFSVIQTFGLFRNCDSLTSLTSVISSWRINMDFFYKEFDKAISET